MPEQENEAVVRLKQGDLGGLETLIKAHQVKAARTAYLIVRDAAVAEDVVEDAFLRAYERIDQFETGRPFGPWFLKIVINLARRTAARRERHLFFTDAGRAEEIDLEELLVDLSPTLEELTEQAAARSAVWAALGRLTPDQRAAIVQRYYLDWSEKEIAAQTESPVGTIKWRLHSARERLRDWLRPLWHADMP